jgi:PDZ domain-containing protein
VTRRPSLAGTPPEATLRSGPPPGGADRRERPRRAGLLAAIGTVLVVLAIAASFVRLPYYTISPGDAIGVHERVTVEGVPTYETEGDVLLLFVRQRSDINVWEYVQAALDSDIDLFREEEIRGSATEEEFDAAADADMTLSQIAAKKVALERAGYEVPRASEGVVVLAVLASQPAARAVARGDTILAVDGVPIVEADDLGEQVRAHEPGDVLVLEVVRRDGERETTEVEVSTDAEGRPIIGVFVAPQYDFPVEIDIDTDTIGGPSAGLAMALALLDELTRGALTGGLDVAVTGTISESGEVGEIGGISQKAVAARQSGADVFLVPACRTEAALAACERDVARARSRAGDMDLVTVETFDDALRALEVRGGDPVGSVERPAA